MRYDDPADIPADDLERWHPFANCYQLAFHDTQGWEADLAFDGQRGEEQFIRLHCLGINPVDPTDAKPCPTLGQCGEWSRSRRVFLPGVWGGMTTEERSVDQRSKCRKAGIS